MVERDDTNELTNRPETISPVDVTTQRDALHGALTFIYPGIGYVPALDAQSAITELRSAKKQVKRTFTLSGKHRETGLERTCVFTVTFSTAPHFQPHEAIDIHVSTADDPKFTIPLRYLSERRDAGFGTTTTAGLSGYGFYSIIVTNVLNGIDHVDNPVTNDKTRLQHRHNREIPHSALAESSPLVAARKGFIAGLDNSGTHLTAIRVPPRLAYLLDIATAYKRDPQGINPVNLARAMKRYMEPGACPKEAQEMLAYQIRELDPRAFN